MIKTGQQGFSLLEVLVAFSVLALSLGVLFSIFGKGVHNIALAEDYVQATIMAESQLAVVGTDGILEEGEFEGEYDERFHWVMNISLYEPADAEGNTDVLNLDNYPVQPYLIELSVRWDQESTPRELNLSTLRMQARGAER